jgi:hypothetical protein
MPFFFFFAAMATVTVTTATITTTVATAILAATLAAARAIRTRHRASGDRAAGYQKLPAHYNRSTYLQGVKPECLHGTGGRASCRQINMIVNVNMVFCTTELGNLEATRCLSKYLSAVRRTFDRTRCRHLLCCSPYGACF